MSINGMPVGGMSADAMREALEQTFGKRVAGTQVTIYTDDESAEIGSQELSEEERLALSERLEAGDDEDCVSSWSTDALSLKGSLPYDEVIAEALALGRDDGGLPVRLGLLVSGRDIDLNVEFSDEAVNTLASEIEQLVGDARTDASVVIEEGSAYAVEGHDGLMIDRDWFKGQLSDAFLSEGDSASIVAEVVDAPSRIDLEQAESMANAVNRALSVPVTFKFEDQEWTVYGYELGQWTKVDIVEDDYGYSLEAGIDIAAAKPDVARNVDATVSADNVTVTFEDTGQDILVHAAGSRQIPDVASALEELDQQMYGPSGTAWRSDDTSGLDIAIGTTQAPEEMDFEEALASGVITTIGEYTTEFSNYEGTENRNHNIKLCADILNNGIVAANGGTWRFNDRSGNTNEEAGFWAAGSIVAGEIVDSIGGGICQVATTIFNAVYEAGLGVVERHNHTLYMANYPAARDAAVDYPSLDLEWRNDLASDILLRLTYTDTTITATLYSVYTGYTTSSELGTWEDGPKYTTVFKEDDSLGEGQYYVKTAGEDGGSLEITRTVYDDKGQVISTQTFASLYQAKDEVIVIGPGTDTKPLERDVDEGETAEATEATEVTEGEDAYA